MRLRITNHSGLPEAVVKAVMNDSYSKGDCDYSITTLLQPPRKVALERQHANEIEEDAADRIWSLVGQSVHTILERANSTAITERRLYCEIDGVKISGQMDHFVFSERHLSDYKVTSVYKVKGGGIPIEFEQQLNCYAFLLVANGENATKLDAVCILRDWSKREASRSKEYPQSQVVTLSSPVWSPHDQMKFLKERIALHEAAKKSLPECSKSERWARDDVYAVMREGRKTAIRLFPTKDEAEARAETEKGYVQFRPGENIRCNDYCAAAKFCTQFQSLKAKEVNDGTELQNAN